MTDSPRVLLVDDNELNRTLARTIIRRSDHAIVAAITLLEADSLAAARLILAGDGVDVLLLDMHLPDGNGLTLAAELTEHTDRPAIIAVTASVLAEEQQAVHAA